MSDVDVLFSSMGFDKLRADFDNLHRHFENLSAKAQQAASGLSSFGEKLSGVGETGALAATKLGAVVSVIGTGIGVITTLAVEVAKISIALTGLAAAAGGAALFSIGAFTKKIIEETESESKLEIALFGVTKSMEATTRARAFAIQYAVEYGTEMERVLGIVKTFALMPELGKAIKKGDVDEMRRYLDIVSQLQAIKPETSMEAVANAIRMASMGRTMPLRRVTGISAAQLAAEAGFGEKEITQSPAKMMEALEAFTRARGGQELLTKSSELFSRQMQSLSAVWGEWLDQIGNAGVYDLVISKFKALKSAVMEFMGTEQFKTFAEKVSMFLEEFVNRVTAVFTKGIDWSKVTDWESLKGAIETVANNAIEAFLKVWDKIKGPLTKVLVEAFKIAVKVVVFSIKEIFWPVGVSIADTINKAFVKTMNENPMLEAIIRMAPGGTLAGAVITAARMRVAAVEKKEAEEKAKSKEEPTEIKSEYEKWVDKLRKVGFTVVGVFEKIGNIWVMTADSLLKWTESWASMAKSLVMAKTPIEKIEEDEAKDREKKQMKEKWISGEIQDEEWRAFIKKRGGEEDREYKMKGFQAEYEKRLLDISQMSGVGAGTQADIYQKLFGISMERGEPSRAQDYMNKSLDAMVKAQADATKLDEEQLGNLKEIAENTRKMVPGYAPQEGEKVVGGKRTASTPSITARDTPIFDDIYYDVTKGAFTNL